MKIQKRREITTIATRHTLYSDPTQIVLHTIEAAEEKVHYSTRRRILLGIMAGLFIGCGAAASTVAVHNVATLGIAKVLGGIIFPVGLMMILFVGGELFTGDCLMITAFLHKKIQFRQIIKVMLTIYVTNFIGAVGCAFLVFCSGQMNLSGGLLGAYTIHTAMSKVNLTFTSALASGILCNILVCTAVLMCTAARDISGKVWGVFFPIFAFIVSGYEHCVANMYFIPAALFAKTNPMFSEMAMSLYGYTPEDIASLNWGHFLHSIFPVTLGNIIGGMLVVGVIVYYTHHEHLLDAEQRH